MLDIIAQGMIMVFGVTAIGLSQSADERLMKWAPVSAMVAQPAWFYTTYTHEQWGMFVLCFFYLSMWLLGLYNFWFKPNREQA